MPQAQKTRLEPSLSKGIVLVSKALIFATSDPIWAKEAKNRPNHFWQPFGEALVGLIKRNGLDG